MVCYYGNANMNECMNLNLVASTTIRVAVLENSSDQSDWKVRQLCDTSDIKHICLNPITLVTLILPMFQKEKIFNIS